MLRQLISIAQLLNYLNQIKQISIHINQLQHKRAFGGIIKNLYQLTPPEEIKKE